MFTPSVEGVWSGSGEWRTSILCLCGIFFSAFSYTLCSPLEVCEKVHFLYFVFLRKDDGSRRNGGWVGMTGKGLKGWWWVYFYIILVDTIIILIDIYFSSFILFHLSLCSTLHFNLSLIHHLITFSSACSLFNSHTFFMQPFFFFHALSTSHIFSHSSLSYPLFLMLFLLFFFFHFFFFLLLFSQTY